MFKLMQPALFINLSIQYEEKEAGIYTGGLRRCYDRSRPSDNFFSLSENKPCLTPPPPGIAVHPTTGKHTETTVTAAQQDVVTVRLQGSVFSAEVNPSRHAVESFPFRWYLPIFCDTKPPVPGSCEIAHTKHKFAAPFPFTADESHGRHRTHRARIIMQLTFSLVFFLPCDPAFLSVQKNVFFHMMTCRLLKPQGCRETTFCGTLFQYLFFFRKKSTFMVVKVFLKMCVCVWGSLQRAAPSPLFVSLEWNAYSQSLHCWHSRADVIPSLIHNIARAVHIALLPPVARHLTPNMCAAAVRELE